MNTFAQSPQELSTEPTSFRPLTEGDTCPDCGSTVSRHTGLIHPLTCFCGWWAPMAAWQNDGGSALVPDNAKGRAWMAKAEAIQAHGTEAEWDAHSLKLTAIGGEWK